MRNTKAFTLVELIVVITILAILGTIAFISLQGYSAEARDSKRVSDVANIAKKVSLMVAGKEAKSVDDFLDTSSATYIVPTVAVAKSSETATGVVLTKGGNTDAGTPDFTALQQSGEDFKDPTTKADYVYAYETVGSTFQVAATLEEGDKARVVGNYVQFTGTAEGLIETASGVVKDGGSVLPYEL